MEVTCPMLSAWDWRSALMHLASCSRPSLCRRCTSRRQRHVCINRFWPRWSKAAQLLARSRFAYLPPVLVSRGPADCRAGTDRIANFGQQSADVRGAAAFGSLLAAYGAGTLVAMAVSGARPHWRAWNLGLTILLIDALMGLLFLPLGHTTALWEGVALLGAIGTLGGYMTVTVITWIQCRVAPAFLGRAMSVFLFIFMGLAPLSSTVTGWILRSVALPTLFTAAGNALVGLVLLALTGSSLREVTDRSSGASA